MNFCWRITKYNPKYRNSLGAFLPNEWTSYSDIGKIFNSEILTYEEYTRIENLYINAIKYFMNCHNIQALQINTLEKPKMIDADAYNTEDMIIFFDTVKDNDWIAINNIENLCKLILRDKLWCKILDPKKMFIHFGWDFYMYIGSSLPCNNVLSTIKESGLFIEPFESPYT